MTPPMQDFPAEQQSFKENEWNTYTENQTDYFYHRSPARMPEIQIYTLKTIWNQKLIKEQENRTKVAILIINIDMFISCEACLCK